MSLIKNKFRYIVFVLLVFATNVFSQNIANTIPQYIKKPSSQIEYYRFGSGTPIVLIMGYAGDITGWDRILLTDLAKEHEVIVYNNRNVGGSIDPAPQYTMRDLANDTFVLIKSLNLQKPTIVGLSMGGMIAQQLAVDHPNVVSHLVLINTAMPGKRSLPPSDAVKNKLINMPANKIKRFMLALQLFFPKSDSLHATYALTFNRFRPQGFTEIDVDKIRKPQQDAIFAWAKDEETAKKLSTLKIPTLIMYGTADAVIPPENSVLLSEIIPNAKIKSYKNGGHVMTFQFPQEIAAEINDFVAKTKS